MINVSIYMHQGKKMKLKEQTAYTTSLVQGKNFRHSVRSLNMLIASDGREQDNAATAEIKFLAKVDDEVPNDLRIIENIKNGLKNLVTASIPTVLL